MLRCFADMPILAQRFVDYENEIRVLKTRLREQQERHKAALATQQAVVTEQAAIIPPEKPSLSRFGSFMRKPSLTPTPSFSRDPSAREQELEASLTKEKTARAEAEKRVREIDAEMEELSASLFQQANDMVSKERRENARLKETIANLEGAEGRLTESIKRENEKLRQRLQVMEQRDIDRKRRLEKLEAAQRRIDRVRTMLVPR